jgi:glyoxylase-like metal-dependent hydrolase (beta-lactamase superfamily II)
MLANATMAAGLPTVGGNGVASSLRSAQGHRISGGLAMQQGRHWVRTSKVLLKVCSLILCSSFTFSQDVPSFSQFRQLALAALGSEELSRLEFTAQGWEACVGQPWRIDAGWARWELLNYRRVLDVANGTSLQTAQRRSGLDADKLGGCGAQPQSQATAQQTALTSLSSWENQLPLWLTPQGFMALATRQAASVQATAEGHQLSFTVVHNGATYPFTGTFNQAHLLTHIDTRLDDAVLGDMVVTADFGPYQRSAGVAFPTTLRIEQGGFATLQLQITGVVPNTTASSEAPPRPATGVAATFGGGTPAAAGEALTPVTAGIWVSNGAYQAVIVEMERAIVVIDGLQNDSRSAAIIEQAKAAIPGKPIRYVISTHLHFDHASGLRAFAAEGTILLTQNANVKFFEAALNSPRTLRDPAAVTPPMLVQGIGESFSLSDPTNRLELHHLQGSLHAADMLIAYLPAIKTVVEADLLQPWISPAFGGNYPGGHPFLRHLDSELERLGLDYDKFIPIHRPPQPPFMTKADLKQVIGK